MELAQLIYYSTPLLDGRKFNISDELENILQTARAHNKGHGITGALFFAPKLFAQILEGSAEEINSLYESICRDSRHTDVTLVLNEPVDERIFKEWSMAYLDESFQANLISKNFSSVESIKPSKISSKNWIIFYQKAHKYMS